MQGLFGPCPLSGGCAPLCLLQAGEEIGGALHVGSCREYSPFVFLQYVGP
jgi:hypothetical protein